MKKLIYGGFGLFLLLLLLCIGIILLFVTDEEDRREMGLVSAPGTAQVSEAVERYRSLFEEYAEKYDVEDYVEVLMAKAMQESGGRLPDVMQSSESLGLPRNTIRDPERSIDVGVRYFSQMLEEANGDVKLALQAYNFGGGFISFVNNRYDGTYSREAAVAFSEQKESQLGWSNYGDVNYVQNVMRYVDGFSSEPVPLETQGEWALPVKQVTITSTFGWRTHPISGEPDFHGALDFDCTRADTIYSVGDGRVTKAVHSNRGLGVHAIVEHGSGEYSVYGHLSAMDVESGEQVRQGEKIGMCGTTGSSTGTHLHLEYRTNEDVRTNDDYRNPAEAIGL